MHFYSFENPGVAILQLRHGSLANDIQIFITKITIVTDEFRDFSPVILANVKKLGIHRTCHCFNNFITLRAGEYAELLLPCFEFGY